ncbi:phage baseplate assembly protein V [Stenotrophomonas sp. PS02298]|uniref:phage baseplate assembly protein V n=1 Tax=Stenotrophomonas sp. PS02298 TaxID=2991424 RepID=UPI00249B98E3|nr:phage baseplate assembly protein V [Stenotrophomonas sp. PS02298]
MNIPNKLRLMISRAVVALIDDARQVQELQLEMLDEEARAKSERFQQYGFTSVPLPGAEAIVVAVGGSRSHMVALAVDDRRYRKRDLAPGEVSLYSHEGDYVLFKNGRIVEVRAGTSLRVDAPNAVYTGNLHVEGNITCDGDISDKSGSMQEMRATFNGHDHGGIQGGTANTAKPNQEMD